MFDKLRKVWNDTRAESNVLVAIVTVVVAVSKLAFETTRTILIIIAAKFSTQVGTQNHSKHSCFLNQLHRTISRSQHHNLIDIDLQL
jgi:hypothetical protein